LAFGTPQRGQTIPDELRFATAVSYISLDCLIAEKDALL
jgi:hypothetical protein